MKYIIHPFIVLFILITLLSIGTARLCGSLLWNFRIPSLRKTYTFFDEYLFEDWSWKKLFKMFIYNEKFYE